MPLSVQEVVSVPTHRRVEELPEDIEEGEAEKIRVGTGETGSKDPDEAAGMREISDPMV